jgi:hypothetical protein
MKGNSTLRNAILEELANPKKNYDILKDIDIPQFEIQKIDIEPMPPLEIVSREQPP